VSSTNPDDAIAAYIASSSPGPSLGTLGATIFTGPVRPPAPPEVPHAGIFVLSTGGPPPDDYFAWNVGQPSIYRGNVQVRVRSNADDYTDGLATARAVRNKLHLATLDLTGQVGCRATNAEPIYLGRDDTEHHEFSVNFTVWWEK